MAQKVRKKRVIVRRKRTRVHMHSFLRRGKVNVGMMAMIFFVGGLALILGMGRQDFTIVKTKPVLQSPCCDSGDGDNCHPIASSSFTVKQNGVNTEYQLLKSSTMLTEKQGHLQPLPVSDYVSGVPADKYIYYSDSDNSANWTKYIDFCYAEVPKQPPMDSIFAETANYPSYECEWIPNDELLYLCIQGCEANQAVGDSAVFDVYFRVSDLTTSGIPDAIKNCPKTGVANGGTGSQELVNLPTSAEHPNLQLETFYISQTNLTSEWVSPFCKPAVYLYPEKQEQVSVKVNPVGKMLVTTPAYPHSGWSVVATPQGEIYSGGTTYDYLFYEAAIADESIVLPKEGYVVAYSDLKTFLPELVTKLGLNEKENAQFTEYWLKALPDSNYYQIKVVSSASLDAIAPLSITPLPKTVIRVTLHFTPLDTFVKLPEPKITKSLRDGFTVVEWGGIFKRDANHPFSCLM